MLRDLAFLLVRFLNPSLNKDQYRIPMPCLFFITILKYDFFVLACTKSKEILQLLRRIIGINYFPSSADFEFDHIGQDIFLPIRYVNFIENFQINLIFLFACGKSRRIFTITLSFQKGLITLW
jgi:hypothetical protein